MELYLPTDLFAAGFILGTARGCLLYARHRNKKWGQYSQDSYETVQGIVSNNLCPLPFGFGLLFRQSVSGLAKFLMFLSCSNRPRDGP